MSTTWLNLALTIPEVFPPLPVPRTKKLTCSSSLKDLIKEFDSTKLNSYIRFDALENKLYQNREFIEELNDYLISKIASLFREQLNPEEKKLYVDEELYNPHFMSKIFFSIVHIANGIKMNIVSVLKQFNDAFSFILPPSHEISKILTLDEPELIGNYTFSQLQAIAQTIPSIIQSKKREIINHNFEGNDLISETFKNIGNFNIERKEKQIEIITQAFGDGIQTIIHNAENFYEFIQKNCSNYTMNFDMRISYPVIDSNVINPSIIGGCYANVSRRIDVIKTMKSDYFKQQLHKAVENNKQFVEIENNKGIILSSDIAPLISIDSFDILFSIIQREYFESMENKENASKYLKNSPLKSILNLPFREISTAFASAASGNIKQVENLIKDDPASFGEVKEDNISPFFAALFNGNFDVVELILINSKITPVPFINHTNETDFTPIFYGIFYDFPYIVDLMLAKGANLKQTLKSDKKTPIHYAAKRDRVSCLQTMLKSNQIDSSFPDDCLHYAAQFSPLCAHLINNNKYLNNHKKDIFGKTPYDYAIENGFYAFSNTLSKHDESNKIVNEINSCITSTKTDVHLEPTKVISNFCNALSSGITKLAIKEAAQLKLTAQKKEWEKHQDTIFKAACAGGDLQLLHIIFPFVDMTKIQAATLIAENGLEAWIEEIRKYGADLMKENDKHENMLDIAAKNKDNLFLESALNTINEMKQHVLDKLLSRIIVDASFKLLITLLKQLQKPKFNNLKVTPEAVITPETTPEMYKLLEPHLDMSSFSLSRFVLKMSPLLLSSIIPNIKVSKNDAQQMIKNLINNKREDNAFVIVKALKSEIQESISTVFPSLTDGTPETVIKAILDMYHKNSFNSRQLKENIKKFNVGLYPIQNTSTILDFASEIHDPWIILEHLNPNLIMKFRFHFNHQFDFKNEFNCIFQGFKDIFGVENAGSIFMNTFQDFEYKLLEQVGLQDEFIENLKDVLIANNSLFAADSNGQTLFHIAASLYSLNQEIQKEILDLLKKNKKKTRSIFNIQNSRNETLLLTYAKHGNIPAVDYLIEADADITCRTIELNNVLHCLLKAHVEYEPEPIVLLFAKIFQKSRNLFLQKNRKNKTPFIYAAKNGMNGLLGFFSQMFPIEYLEQVSEEQPLTSLHFAAKSNKEITVRYLVQILHVNVNIIYIKSNQTPLHIAAIYSSIDAFRELIRLGGNPLMKNKNGETAIELALKYGSKKMIDFILHTESYSLIQKDVSILSALAFNKSGYSVLLNILPHVRKQLLNSCDEYGHNPLMIAVASHNIKACSELLNHRIDPFAVTNNKDNLIHLCAQYNSISCSRVILQRYFFEDRKDVILFLLNSKDSNGQTPIHIAIKEKHNAFISHLLHYSDLNLEILNNDNKNAFEYAMHLNNKDAAALIGVFSGEKLTNELLPFEEESKLTVGKIRQNQINFDEIDKIQIVLEKKENEVIDEKELKKMEEDPCDVIFNQFIHSIECDDLLIHKFPLIFNNDKIQELLPNLQKDDLKEVMEILIKTKDNPENIEIISMLFVMILPKVSQDYYSPFWKICELFSTITINKFQALFQWITNCIVSIAELEHLKDSVQDHLTKLYHFTNKMNNEEMATALPLPAAPVPIHEAIQKLSYITNKDKLLIRIRWLQFAPLIEFSNIKTKRLNWYSVEFSNSLQNENQLIDFLISTYKTPDGEEAITQDRPAPPKCISTAIQVTMDLFKDGSIPLTEKRSIINKVIDILKCSPRYVGDSIGRLFNAFAQIINEYGISYLKSHILTLDNAKIQDMYRRISLITRLKDIKEARKMEVITSKMPQLKKKVMSLENMRKDPRTKEDVLHAFESKGSKFKAYSFAFDGTPVYPLSTNDFQSLHEFASLLEETPIVSDIQEYARKFSELFANNPTIENCTKLIALLRQVIFNTFEITPYLVQCYTVFSLLLHRINKHNNTLTDPTIKGRIAQVATEEGKSIIVAMLAAAIALTGDFVDVISSSPYLAERDAKEFKPFYKELGLKCDSFEYGANPMNFNAHILYSTNTSFEFVRLDEGINGKPKMMTTPLEGIRTRRTKMTVIVDEADNLFIDTAQNSARIGHRSSKSISWIYKPILDMVMKYPKTIDPQKIRFALAMADDGKHSKEASEFTDKQIIRWIKSAKTALEKKIKKDYVVGQNKETTAPEVQIVDQSNTGRILYGSRWVQGVHEFVEAKENIPISQGSGTIASISHPTFFKDYQEIYGLTGTMGEESEREEIKNMYKLENFDVPPNRPCLRKRLPTQIYPTNDDKHNAIINIIKNNIKEGRPTLVIVLTIEESQELSGKLKYYGIKHYVLNDYQQESEDFIIQRAGSPSSVTIATNTAGRGTDIKLDHEALENGGLYVILAFFPVNLRVECQALGRAGRQGQKGSCQIIFQSNEYSVPGLPDASEYTLENVYNERSTKVREESKMRMDSVKRDVAVYAVLNFFFNYMEKLKLFFHTYEAKSSLQKDNPLIGIKSFEHSFIAEIQDKWSEFFTDLDADSRNDITLNQLQEENFAKNKFSEFLELIRPFTQKSPEFAKAFLQYYNN